MDRCLSDRNIIITVIDTCVTVTVLRGVATPSHTAATVPVVSGVALGGPARIQSELPPTPEILPPLCRTVRTLKTRFPSVIRIGCIAPGFPGTIRVATVIPLQLRIGILVGGEFVPMGSLGGPRLAFPAGLGDCYMAPVIPANSIVTRVQPTALSQRRNRQKPEVLS